MRKALYGLPKAIYKIQNPPLPIIESVEDSNDLHREGVKFIILSNIIDIYTSLEVLLGLKLPSHTATLTEANKLLDELYKRGDTQNEQQYRNALGKFQT